MLQRRWCSFHADRPAHAACVSCHKVLCQECATAYDGIFHCAGCLARQRGRAAAGSSPLGWIATLAAIAVLLVLQARLTVWTGVLLAGLR